MFATKKQVKDFKERAAAWKEADYPNADPRIPEVMDLINQIDHIAAVWSCEGHPRTEENYKQRPKDFYIMFVVEKRGFETMQRIYEFMGAILANEQEECEKVLATNPEESLENSEGAEPLANYSRISEFRMTFTTRKLTPDICSTLTWHRVTILAGDTRTEGAKTILFDALLKILRHLVEQKSL